MTRKFLDAAAFAESNVWMYADDMEHKLPCPVDGVLPNDCGILFVKAELTTAGGTPLDGYVTVDGGVYAISIVSEGESYGFNAMLEPLADTTLASLRQDLRVLESDPVLPLAYRCAYGFRGEPALAGVFEFASVPAGEGD